MYRHFAILLAASVSLAACGDDAESYSKQGIEIIEETIFQGKVPTLNALEFNSGALAVFAGEELPWAELVTPAGKKPETFHFSLDPQTGQRIVSFNAPSSIACRLIVALPQEPSSLLVNVSGAILSADKHAEQINGLCAEDKVYYWTLAFNRPGQR